MPSGKVAGLTLTTRATKKATAVDNAEVLPAVSVALARSVWPSVSGSGNAKPQAPPASAEVVPAVAPSSTTVIVLSASAVPVTVGWALATVPMGAVITGGAGAVESFVMDVLALALLPAASRCVPLTVSVPSAIALRSTVAVKTPGPGVPHRGAAVTVEATVMFTARPASEHVPVIA